MAGALPVGESALREQPKEWAGLGVCRASIRLTAHRAQPDVWAASCAAEGLVRASAPEARRYPEKLNQLKLNQVKLKQERQGLQMVEQPVQQHSSEHPQRVTDEQAPAA